MRGWRNTAQSPAARRAAQESRRKATKKADGPRNEAGYTMKFIGEAGWGGTSPVWRFLVGRISDFFWGNFTEWPWWSILGLVTRPGAILSDCGAF